jgi:hypothetical protein
MTNNELPTNYYNSTMTDSGRLSHKACAHPATPAHRQNCRYETAKKNFAETAARRAARGPVAPIDPSTIVIGYLN